jgi:hypothetical protein
MRDMSATSAGASLMGVDRRLALAAIIAYLIAFAAAALIMTLPTVGLAYSIAAIPLLDGRAGAPSQQSATCDATSVSKSSATSSVNTAWS